MQERIRDWARGGMLFAVLAIGQAQLSAQPQIPVTPVTPLTLADAVELAMRSAPVIRASIADVSATERGIQLARTAYMPSAEVRLGVNRATRNNVFGLTLPNSVIPAISGPVLDASTFTSTFGSSLGILFSWEPVDFGLRGANVRLAEAYKASADARQTSTAYEVSLAVSDAYLLSLANQQAVEIATATVERMQVFADAVAVLVRNELRPGADESRAQAELARARIEQIHAEAGAAAALATLAEAIGVAGETVVLRPGRLLDDLPAGLSAAPSPTGQSVARHPLAAAQDAEVAVAEARTRAAARSWRPTVQLQSAFYGRGTGARIDGTFEGGAGGLAPSTPNWAIGVNVNFDVLGFAGHRARQAIETDRTEREHARKDVIAQELTGEVARATIGVNAAREIARITPIELEATRTLEAQALARYSAGLGTVVEVAEAQRLLRQGEVDAALARLGVWRALFGLAAATGDMDALLRASSP